MADSHSTVTWQGLGSFLAAPGIGRHLNSCIRAQARIRSPLASKFCDLTSFDHGTRRRKGDYRIRASVPISAKANGFGRRTEWREVSCQNLNRYRLRLLPP